MIRFVGAGPGAVDLITVRGMEYLKKADVVIYAGSLVNPALLEYAPRKAKICNSAFMTLEEVMDVMISADASGQEVVRLHTGDASLYGAVREQMDLLDSHHIPYESCPGVSACFGAAAGLNLGFALPGITQTLIVTRLAGKTAVPEKEKLRLLASHGSSMAIYLSAGMLGALSAELLAGGYAPDTPAAIVYKATWPEEKTVMCTVKTLEEAGRQHQITKTAVVLVGDVLLSNGAYERSRLYSPDFSTQFRQAKED